MCFSGDEMGVADMYSSILIVSRIIQDLTCIIAFIK